MISQLRRYNKALMFRIFESTVCRRLSTPTFVSVGYDSPIVYVDEYQGTLVPYPIVDDLWFTKNQRNIWLDTAQ